MNREFVDLTKMTVHLQEFTGSRKRKDIFFSRLIFNNCFLGGPHRRELTRVKTSELVRCCYMITKIDGSFLAYFIEITCFELVPFSGKYTLYSRWNEFRNNR